MAGTSYFTRRLVALRFEDAVAFGTATIPTEGDFAFGPINAENAEHQPVNDRDQHDGFTLGADLVQDCSLTIRQRDRALTSAVQQYVEDFVMRRAGSPFASGSVTSLDDTIWSWKTIVTFNNGAGGTGTVTLPKCEGALSFKEGQPANTWTLAFKNYRAPTFT